MARALAEALDERQTASHDSCGGENDEAALWRSRCPNLGLQRDPWLACPRQPYAGSGTLGARPTVDKSMQQRRFRLAPFASVARVLMLRDFSSFLY